MAFDFSDFGVLTEFLVEYLFGTTVVLGVFIFVAFLLYMTLNGVPLPVALSIVLPLSLSLGVSGWFGDSYILAMIIVVLGLVLSNIMVRLYVR